mmetsp:Transcript_32335/g.77216  ORF Transcript_32335/g.77216 Transcript_32335/m.77216 type:complete len:216 (+) Transcript_32335:253-900(+)
MHSRDAPPVHGSILLEVVVIIPEVSHHHQPRLLLSHIVRRALSRVGVLVLDDEEDMALAPRLQVAHDGGAAVFSDVNVPQVAPLFHRAVVCSRVQNQLFRLCPLSVSAFKLEPVLIFDVLDIEAAARTPHILLHSENLGLLMLERHVLVPQRVDWNVRGHRKVCRRPLSAAAFYRPHFGCLPLPLCRRSLALFSPPRTFQDLQLPLHSLLCSHRG